MKFPAGTCVCHRAPCASARLRRKPEDADWPRRPLRHTCTPNGHITRHLPSSGAVSRRGQDRARRDRPLCTTGKGAAFSMLPSTCARPYAQCRARCKRMSVYSAVRYYMEWQSGPRGGQPDPSGPRLFSVETSPRARAACACEPREGSRPPDCH